MGMGDHLFQFLFFLRKRPVLMVENEIRESPLL